MLSLGPNPTGVSTADRQAGAIDLSYTFTTPGQYMIFCNFRPHVLGYGQAAFLIVRGQVPATPAGTTGSPAPAAPAAAAQVPAPAKTGMAGLVEGNGTHVLLPLAVAGLAVTLLAGARLATARRR